MKQKSNGLNPNLCHWITWIHPRLRMIRLSKGLGTPELKTCHYYNKVDSIRLSSTKSTVCSTKINCSGLTRPFSIPDPTSLEAEQGLYWLIGRSRSGYLATSLLALGLITRSSRKMNKDARDIHIWVWRECRMVSYLQHPSNVYSALKFIIEWARQKPILLC